ncbi:hypothetical protein CMV_015406 [Castanea mollissima]|uniref:Uncharacterized protein n=1 Tax=Castanea mollissima TaxID=60419 RepID=A0A8J4R974_9ROSI|nr:hypothetical protein CMV_015406 [Castanea mollissima]
MSHLKAVYFLRPTSENIQHLRQQLASPRFGEYHLFFSNILKDTQIHNLADADEQEVVQQIQEFYADFVAIDPDHFTLNMPSNHIYMLPAVVDPSNSQHFCDRVVGGIVSIFLALKRIPIIRYQRNSDIAKRIAQETAHGGLRYNIPSIQHFESAEDMAKFVDKYPEYRKMHGNVSKHVTLVTEMSKIVEERKLMLVSETEQELACNGGQVAAFEAVTNLLNNESVSDIDRLRLVMLYALRYEKESPVQLMQLFNKLASRSAKYKPGLVQFVLKQAGVDKRTGDLFGNRDLLNIARNMARGLKGVENVYTQHQPLLFQTMESISKGRLRDVDYPYVGNHFQQGRPQEVVIFIVGGTTYEESRSVALQNASNSGIRFILGGSVVLNSKSGKIVNEYWEEELDDHQNQPTFLA